MSSKQTSIDKLNMHLFEAIEMLKNNSDERADAHEKIDVNTARAIADLSKNIIEGYKVKVQALTILSKTDNPRTVNSVLQDEGFLTTDQNTLEVGGGSQ